MTEIVYLLRLLSHSIGFLLAGLVLGGLGLHPIVRTFTGLPEDAVDRAVQAELAFDWSCPGQGSVARAWSLAAVAPTEHAATPEHPGDVAGALTSETMRIGEKLWAIVRPWLVLIGIRGTALVAVLASALPLALSVWLLGRRRSWVRFRRGTPATDAQRLAWVWAMGLIVTLVGVLIAIPLAAPMTPWLLPLVVLMIAVLYPIRAATAARL